jgi:hypothetical protein
MANRWLSHIKKTMKMMKSKGTYKKGDGLKKVIMEAKKHWSKVKRGGVEGSEESDSSSDEEEKAPVTEAGRRHRKSKKSRKTRRRRHH